MISLEYWARTDGVLLGVVAIDRIDRDFGFVVLGRDEHGRFRGIEAVCSWPTQDKARDMLFDAMCEISATGATVFPQDQVPPWLRDGPLPDWIAGDPGKQFGTVAEAWTEVEAYAREIAPHMEEQERRALQMVFYAGARSAVEVLPGSNSYGDFETLMAGRWEAFVHDCVLPCLYPKIRPVFFPEAVQREMSGCVDYQHGYWQAGTRAALQCRRRGIGHPTVLDEIETVGKEVRQRRQEARPAEHIDG